MPFVKGQSGNPSGRAKIPDEFKDLAKEKSLPMLQRLIAIAENPDEKTEHVIRASETVIAYGYGKPQQSVEVTGNMKIEIKEPDFMLSDE